MKVRDLEKLEDTIYKILVENEKARSDDMFLYITYCIKKDISPTRCFCNLFFRKTFRQECKIATFAAVERARRKVQEKYPELKANVEARAEEEKTYKEYARNNNTII